MIIEKDLLALSDVAKLCGLATATFQIGELVI